jgi:hypothetical protein
MWRIGKIGRMERIGGKGENGEHDRRGEEAQDRRRGLAGLSMGHTCERAHLTARDGLVLFGGRDLRDLRDLSGISGNVPRYTVVINV